MYTVKQQIKIPSTKECLEEANGASEQLGLYTVNQPIRISMSEHNLFRYIYFESIYKIQFIGFKCIFTQV
jgi:hypothetical protein